MASKPMVPALTPQKLRNRVAMNVRRLREERPITQSELAWHADLCTRHLQKIEEAECNVTLRTLVALGNALDVDPAVLVSEPPPKKS